MQQDGRIYQISISNGGVPKVPVPEARVGLLGLEGDHHRDMVRHGGPERAVCLYSLEQIEALNAEGHPLQPGAIGENITTRGLDLAALVPGDRVTLGEGVLLEITRYVTPCKNIKDGFVDGDFSRVLQTTRPGWSRLYARVVQGGMVRVGDPVQALPLQAVQPANE